MRRAKVFWNKEQAGILTEYHAEHYEFRYDDLWYANDRRPAISVTLPKTQAVYEADHLFPFFFNMLSEGVNKRLQCRHLKIDEADYFGLLLATAKVDTVGAVTVEPLEAEA